MVTSLLRIICLLALTCVGASGCNHSNNGTDTQDPEKKPTERPEGIIGLPELLKELASEDAPTRFPSIPYESRQESSYDRRSVSPNTPEWFANDDGWGYVRMENNDGREEKVIFDEQHPGVISRIWLTSFGSPDTIIRFYFDGAKDASWTISSFNLKSFGEYANVMIGDEFAQPSSTWIRGSSLYLPIPYAKSCKITIQELKDPITTSRYYQINYRRYPDDAYIETLSPSVLRSNSAMLASCGKKLSDRDVLIYDYSIEEQLDPSGQHVLDLPAGAQCVKELLAEVKAIGTSYGPTIADSLFVEGWFDGARTLSVPITGLAGCGVGGHSAKNLRSSSSGRATFDIRWIMPYRESGRLVFVNKSSVKVSLRLGVATDSYKWDDSSLYFHGDSQDVKDMQLRHFSDMNNGYEWDFASIAGGRGVYFGDVFSVNNHTTGWPGEGDEKIWVDTESFPSHFGTGWEDYYTFCGYFLFGTPFCGEPRLDSSNYNGWHVYYRMRGLDAIPFSQRLTFKLEMQGWEVGTIDICNSVFWYGDLTTTSRL